MDQSYEAKPVQYIRCILCLISTNFGIKNLEGKNMSNYKFVLLLPLMFHVFFKSFPGWTFSLQWFFDIFYSSGKAVRLSTSAEKFPVWVGELKPSRVMRRCWHRQFVKKSSHKRQKKTTCRFVGGGLLKTLFLLARLQWTSKCRNIFEDDKWYASCTGRSTDSLREPDLSCQVRIATGGRKIHEVSSNEYVWMLLLDIT